MLLLLENYPFISMRYYKIERVGDKTSISKCARSKKQNNLKTKQVISEYVLCLFVLLPHSDNEDWSDWWLARLA